MTPVLITTENRGVYYGRLAENNAPGNVVLDGARVVASWDTRGRGFLVLASDGPEGVAEVSPAVGRLTVYGVATIAECSESAAKAWDDAP